MKTKILAFINLSLLLLILSDCKGQNVFKNRAFEGELTNYCNYLDTVECKKDYDYILIKATSYKDSVTFEIYLNNGAYEFLEYKDSIIDFFNFKGYDVMLLGDFPNEVVSNAENQKLNVLEGIVKNRYPKEYKKYLQNKEIPAPLIYDYMSMNLVFLKGKLICSKRTYY